jgi:hypothetical protein
MVSLFCFLRNLYNDFNSGCTNLHSHQQHIRVPMLPNSLHPHHCLLFVSLMIAVLTGMRRNLSVILIYTWFMAENVEPFFMYFLAICISFGNCLFNLFAHLLDYLEFWCLIFWALNILWLLFFCLMNSL